MFDNLDNSSLAVGQNKLVCLLLQSFFSVSQPLAYFYQQTVVKKKMSLTKRKNKLERLSAEYSSKLVLYGRVKPKPI
jgi:hypothetical protein